MLSFYPVEWSDLKVLAELLPVRPMSSDCTCGDAAHAHTRGIAHADGWLVECLTYHARWVEWRLRDVGGRSPLAQE